jgi:hypothetical protein
VATLQGVLSAAGAWVVTRGPDHPRRRSQDKGWRYWVPWTYRHLVPALAVAVAAWALINVEGDQERFQAEAKERRDQGCVIFERNQAEDILRLQRTYDYLAGLSSEQMREPINRAILAQLSSLEDDAELDDAPQYCDEPGIGQPEPDLVVPERPLALRGLRH